MFHLKTACLEFKSSETGFVNVAVNNANYCYRSRQNIKRIVLGSWMTFAQICQIHPVYQAVLLT